MEVVVAEAYLEPSQASKVEIFAKIGNGFQPLFIFTIRSILEAWHLNKVLVLVSEESF